MRTRAPCARKAAALLRGQGCCSFVADSTPVPCPVRRKRQDKLHGRRRDGLRFSCDHRQDVLPGFVIFRSIDLRGSWCLSPELDRELKLRVVTAVPEELGQRNQLPALRLVPRRKSRPLNSLDSHVRLRTFSTTKPSLSHLCAFDALTKGIRNMETVHETLSHRLPFRRAAVTHRQMHGEQFAGTGGFGCWAPFHRAPTS
jgi:hypothetical protein